MRARESSLLLLAIACSIMSCARTEPQARSLPPPDSVVMISDADTGRTIAVTTGQRLVVRLGANHTTGYSWSLAARDSGALIHIGEPSYALDTVATGTLGAPGVESWSFRAQRAGMEELRFEYRRPWEATGAPAEARSFMVHASP